MSRNELIEIKEFAAVIFDSKDKDFVIHIVSISQDSDVYPSQRPQIASFKAHEVPNSFPHKYTNLVYIFSKDLVVELQLYIGIKDYAIELIKDYQLPYKAIYS